MAILGQLISRNRAVITCAVVAYLAASAAPAAALSLYQVGNSFTADSMPEGTAAMLETLLEENIEYGYHIRGNQGLDSLWNDPTAPDTEITNFGDHTVALPSHSWDFLTLQTFQTLDSDNTLGQEVARIQDFAAAADQGGGGETEIVIYGPWRGNLERNWNGWHNELPADPDPRVAYTAAYHDALYDEVAELYPDRVRLASAGKVIREVRDRILADDFPINYVYDLYRDPIHLDYGIGRFIASTTMATVISRMNPIGLPVPREVSAWSESEISDEQALAIQQVVWEVLTEDKRSGLSPIGDLNTDTFVDEVDRSIWGDSHGAQTAISADANRDGVVDQTDANLWLDAYAPGSEDIDNNGVVQPADYDLWHADYGGGSGPTDINDDGIVDAADYTLWRDALVLAERVDFDQDGQVTTADLDLWQSQNGWATELQGDANSDGVVNAADYTIWRDGLAAFQQGIILVEIPEPGAGVLLTIAAGSLLARRRV